MLAQKIINLFTEYDLSKEEFIKEWEKNYSKYGSGDNFSMIGNYLQNNLEKIKSYHYFENVKFIDLSDNDYQGTYRFYLLIGEKIISFFGSYGSCDGCGSDYPLDDLLELFEKAIMFDLCDIKYNRDKILKELENRK